MKKIIIGLPLLFSFLLHIVILSASLKKLPGLGDDYYGFGQAWILVFVLYPLAILVPVIVAAFTAKEHKLKYMSYTLLTGIVINALFFFALNSYQSARNQKIIYKEDPSNASLTVVGTTLYPGIKAVYKGEDIDGYRKDCAVRRGRFNECGSPCAPSLEACISVCAFTCELTQ